MNIQVIERQGQAVLVEWVDATGPHRCILPADKVRNGAAEFADLENGIPYGVPWELLYMLTVTPQQIARLFRERGIWTEEDMQRNITQARAAIEQAYSIDFKALIDNVRQSREGGTA